MFFWSWGDSLVRLIVFLAKLPNPGLRGFETSLKFGSFGIFQIQNRGLVFFGICV